ncbi:MAG: nuclear transport factor 2 family protein [Deltaproteobacteria bacterium]|nr:nuclear transport factor 2 family protein [Deltaproteobacteria bacterium]
MNERNLRNLADELEIRALVARYADAVNRVAADDWIATWADDGEWRLMGQVVTGHAALVPFWKNAMGMFRWVIQLVHQGTIALDGDRATARFYISEVGERADGARSSMVGVYSDECVRTAAGWRFARRSFDALYWGTPDLAGSVFGFPADKNRPTP